MNRLKNIYLGFTSGAVLGGAITSFSAPRVVEWWNMPGAGSALCNCKEVITSTAESLVKVQCIGALIGGVVLAVVVAVFGAARPKADVGATP